jgi:hypothetical protein
MGLDLPRVGGWESNTTRDDATAETRTAIIFLIDGKTEKNDGVKSFSLGS